MVAIPGTGPNPIYDPVSRPPTAGTGNVVTYSTWQTGGVFYTNAPPSVPKPKALARTAQAVAKQIGTIQVARPGDPEPYMIGSGIATPTIIGAGTDSQGRLVLDMLWSVGPISSIDYLLVGTENIGTFDSLGNAQHFTGAAGQATSSLMQTVKGGSYDALAGKAHSVLVFQPGWSLDIKAHLTGMLLYDPRLDSTNGGSGSQREDDSTTWTLSRNVALVMARMEKDCGNTLNWSTVITAADYCDEVVGTESRWAIDMQVLGRASHADWRETFRQYAGGMYVDVQGGVVSFVPDVPRASNHTVTSVSTASGDKILAGSFQLKKAGSRNVPQRVSVHYRDATGADKTAETATSADPGTTTRLQMPGFTSYSMARRFATIVYNKAHNDLSCSFTSFDVGLLRTLGDIGEITHGSFGLSSKAMTLINYRQLERGRWAREYAEYDAANYSDELFTEPSTGDTNLINPNTPVDGPTPTMTEELYTSGGSTHTRFKITFTGVTWPYAVGYRVVVQGTQNVLEIPISNLGAVTHTVPTGTVIQGTVYSTSVYVVSNTGALSATPGTAMKTALGKLLPPGDVSPSSLIAYEVGTLVAMNWGAAEEIAGDLRGYMIKRLPYADFTNTAADWTHTNAVTLVERLDGTAYLTPSQPAGEYVYGVKAIDNAGNYSTNAAWKYVNVTANSGSSNTVSLGAGTVTNMRVFVLDGVAEYAVTDGGLTWEDLWPSASPELTWEDVFAADDTWESQEQVSSIFETEDWDVGSVKQGNWNWSDQNVTFWGGTQANRTIVGDDSSPISYVTHSGNAVQSAGQHLIAQVFNSDSPITPGGGFSVRLPIDVSFSGAILDQDGIATIDDTSPLVNPIWVAFPISYTSAPIVQATALGTSFLVAVVDDDSITAAGFYLYLFGASATLSPGSAKWTAKGT